MRVAECAIEIAAPIEDVWRVMIDLGRYHEWNPFIVRVDASGAVGNGSRITLHVKWAGGGGASSKELVTRFDAPRNGAAALEYVFTGWMATLAMVRATRLQALTQVSAGVTRYHTREQFGGWLAAAIPLGKVQRGFEMHAESLKRRAESLVGKAAPAAP
jgi:hypothetical protein